MKMVNEKMFKGTWQWVGFPGIFAEIGSSYVDPLHYLSSCFDFGFKFAETFIIEKRLPDSPSRGVADSLTRRVGESAFECLRENSASRGVAMMSRGVAIQIFYNLSSNYSTLNS